MGRPQTGGDISRRAEGRHVGLADQTTLIEGSRVRILPFQPRPAHTSQVPAESGPAEPMFGPDDDGGAPGVVAPTEFTPALLERPARKEQVDSNASMRRSVSECPDAGLGEDVGGVRGVVARLERHREGGGSTAAVGSQLSYVSAAAFPRRRGRRESRCLTCGERAARTSAQRVAVAREGARRSRRRSGRRPARRPPPSSRPRGRGLPARGPLAAAAGGTR